MKNIEALEKAVQDLNFALGDLTEANKSANAVEHMVLIPIIKKTQCSYSKAKELLRSVKED